MGRGYSERAVLPFIALLAFFSSTFPQAETTLATAPSVIGELQTYAVAPGDGLYAVARRFGLAFSAVARVNRIEKPNLVRAGKILTLPTRYIPPAIRQEGILVNIPESRLYFFREGILKAVYPATVGVSTWRTPMGAFTVTVKLEDPSWSMPADLARAEKVQREVVAPGPDNPLGDYWIGTSLKHTGIHSTNAPMTVGRPLSHGCVRLYPEHIEALFREVKVGETGEFIYEPVKAALDGEDILIEVLAAFDLGANLAHGGRLEYRDDLPLLAAPLDELRLP